MCGSGDSHSYSHTDLLKNVVGKISKRHSSFVNCLIKYLFIYYFIIMDVGVETYFICFSTNESNSHIESLNSSVWKYTPET